MEELGCDIATHMLKASLAAAIDVLGSTEASSICKAYLKPVNTEVTIRRVTVTGACVASSHMFGDVFIPSAVLSEEKVTVGKKLQVSMVQTSTGRSAYLVTKAEEVEDDGWCSVVSKKQKSQPTDSRLAKGSTGKGKGNVQTRENAKQHRR